MGGFRSIGGRIEEAWAMFWHLVLYRSHLLSHADDDDWDDGDDDDDDDNDHHHDNDDDDDDDDDPAKPCVAS